MYTERNDSPPADFAMKRLVGQPVVLSTGKLKLLTNLPIHSIRNSSRLDDSDNEGATHKTRNWEGTEGPRSNMRVEMLELNQSSQ